MKALVTGGGGFLGGRIVDMLLERGVEVRSFARGAYPRLDALGVEAIQGDLQDQGAVVAACEGVDVVFHVAAKAGIWGDPKAFEGINIGGTENILAGCRAQGVRHLIYTSSPSVIHTGGDIEGGDESLPYPEHFPADYPRTKAKAESMVRDANGPELMTVSLRPHLIWGPGDPHILPRLVAQSKAGKLRRIGDRDPLIDTVYVDNAAEAHLLAWDKCREGAGIGGRVYFITNGEPLGAWTMINRLLKAGGAPPVERSIPLWLAEFAAGVLEWSHRAFKLDGEPRLTRFAVSELATAHYFDITAAKRDLGYSPTVSIENGLERLKASFQA